MLAGGPWFDSAWQRIAYLEHARQRARPTEKIVDKRENAPERVLWEIGVLLAVPLLGAAFVGIVLNFLHIY